MKKRLEPFLLAVLMCLTLLYVPAEAADDLTYGLYDYETGTVTVVSTDPMLMSNTTYPIVCLVGASGNLMKSVNDVTTDANGRLEAKITDAGDLRNMPGLTVLIRSETGPVASGPLKVVYTITLNPNGGTMPSGAVTTMTCEAGQSINLPTGLTKSGYTFGGWMNGSALVSNPYTPTENVTLTAKWEPKTGVTSVTGVNLSSSTTVKVGESKTLTASVIPSDATNKAVTWSTTPGTGSVDISDNGNGSVTITGKTVGTATVTVKTSDGGYTASCAITVKPSTSQTVAVTGVSLDKASETVKVGATTTLTAFIAPSDATDKVVTWSTTPGTGSVDISDNGNGTVTITGKTVGTATVTVTTNDGNFTADCAITVTPSTSPATSHTITATAGFGGSITPSGSVTVPDGTDQAFTITPNYNYVISYVIVDGTSIGARSSYTFTSVTADHTIAVSFDYVGGGGSYPVGGGSNTSTSTSYPVTVPAKPDHGTISVQPTSATKGTTVTITAVPDEGYEVSYVTVRDKDGNDVHVTDGGNGKYTFTMPDSKVTINAAFALVTGEHITTPGIPDTPVTSSVSFTDVSSSMYYYDAVQWAVSQGITNGTTATTFGPDGPCTRGQIVTFLWRAAGSPTMSGSNPFTDVAYGAYYYDAIQWAVAQGITKGTSETTFSPDTPCTRAQAVTFLYRANNSPAASGTNTFVDVASNAYYAAAVQWAVNEAITSGTTATTFSPDMTCTRAQIVTFLYRAQ